MLNTEQQTTGGALLRLIDSVGDNPVEFGVHITTNRLWVYRTGAAPMVLM